MRSANTTIIESNNIIIRARGSGGHPILYAETSIDYPSQKTKVHVNYDTHVVKQTTKEVSLTLPVSFSAFLVN